MTFARIKMPLTHLGLILLSFAVGGCPTTGVPSDGNGNANGNTADNTNDNVADNANDNTVGNANDNTSPFIVFQDPDSDFSTTDVYDVDAEIVRFDPTNDAVIWAADGFAYDPGFWAVDGLFLSDGSYQIRFGTTGGQRRAYFTETVTATICDLTIIAGSVGAFSTNVPVPQE